MVCERRKYRPLTINDVTYKSQTAAIRELGWSAVNLYLRRLDDPDYNPNANKPRPTIVNGIEYKTVREARKAKKQPKP